MTGESRPRQSSRADVLFVFVWFALLILVGYGLRDPWPADEPRFASIARDMVSTGQWLIPHAGGDLYQDKPPLHFWLIAIAQELTGSLRLAFLLPSMLASFGTLWLVQDLARRLHGVEAGRLAAVTLASSVLFVVTTRGAQIDATLIFFCTLALYAFMRHFLIRPHWGWIVLGSAAAGLGVIDKAVGFLTLLLWPIAWWLSRRGATDLRREALATRAVWCVPLVFLAVIAAWLVPMLITVASSGSPSLLAYRDELLFQQTVQRYAAAWHHVKPWYYYFVEVIPFLWLPLIAGLPWLWSYWRRDWQRGIAASWLPLSWAILVVVFFSLSPGKRGVYVLPALPAFVWAAAPHLVQFYSTRAARLVSQTLAAVLALLGVGFAVAVAFETAVLQRVLAEVTLQSWWPIWAFAIAAPSAWWATARWRPIAAWPTVLACLAVCWGIGIAPQINGERSSSEFTRQMLAKVDRERELGLLSYKEQFLLYLDRPVTNFGHARWREGLAESYDASRWLAESERRVLLVPEGLIEPCFKAAPRILAGVSSDEAWWLVSGAPAGDCVARGDPAKVIRYTP